MVKEKKINIDGIDILLVEDFDALVSHGEAWNDLVFSADIFVPTSSFAWLSAYYQHRLRKTDSIFCLFAYQNGELLGVFPLVRKSTRRGIALRAPHDGHTVSVCPVVDKARGKQIFDALTKAIWRFTPSVWRVEFPDVPETFPIDKLVEKHPHTAIYERIGSFLKIETDWDRYYQSLSNNFRNNLRKANNRLGKLGNVDYLFEQAEPGSAQLDELVRVEALGWKGKKGTAIGCSEKVQAFYRTFVEQARKAGWLEWHFMRLNDQVIAAHMGIRGRNELVLWKIGYDETYSKCSPGVMLFYSLAQKSYSDGGVKEIDLLMDAPWHGAWKAEKRRYYVVRLYKYTSPRSLLLGYIPDFVIMRARLLKRKFSN